MGGKKPKKKRKLDQPPDPDDVLSSTSSGSEDEEQVEYSPFRAPNYNRKYDVTNTANNPVEFIVFLSHSDQKLSISDQSRLTISQCLHKSQTKGLKYLKPINKFKVGVVFDTANTANMFLENTKFFEDTKMIATIPAQSTEVTGVVRDVPISYSNKKIFQALNSSKNVVQVKRFMRREKTEDNFILVPTKTVAVTFASTQMPEHIYLDNWRHEVSKYIPPVKQCLKCLRFGHIAKYCKNSQKCSICTESHHFKSCVIDMNNAKCANCKGNHIAVSSQCPIKQQKVEEIKVKSRAVAYSDLLNAKAFPSLPQKISIDHIINSENFINLLVQSVVKIVSGSKEKTINSNNIKKVLVDTFKDFKN